MAASVTVGFIGLGEQGLPIARRIAGTFPTLVWARRPQACAAIPQARAVATVEDLGRAADIVCLCVNGDDDVRELAGRLAPAMAPGKTIVVMSTVLPDTVTDLAARLAPRGIALVDAPVSGGPDGAERGDMVVLVGAGEDDFARVLPLFRTFARLVERLGPVGSGQRLKLINNGLFFAHCTAGAAAMALVRELGIDPAAAGRVLAAGTGASHAFVRMDIAGGGLQHLAQSATAAKDVHHLAAITAGASPEAALLADLAERVFTYAKAEAEGAATDPVRPR